MKRVCLIYFIISIHSAYAVNCHINLNIKNVTFNWTQNNQTIAVNGTVRKNSTSWECITIEIGFSTGQSGSYNREMQNNGDQLAYNIYRDNNTSTPLRTLNDAQNNQQKVIVHMGINEKSKVFSFIAKLPYPNNSRTFFTKGQYRDTITATADAVLSTGTPLRNRNFQFRVNVPPQIDISMVNRGGGFDINDTSQTLNFGLLQENETLGFDMIVRSNAGYSISLSSTNNGQLKHVSQNYFVPYGLKVNGVTKDLSSSSSTPVEVANAPGLTPPSGVVQQVDVQIGSVDNKLHGQYSDFIVVTAMTTD